MQRRSLTLAGAVVVDVAALHAHIAAAVHIHRAVAALVDITVFYGEIVAAVGPDAENAAAVKPAGVHRRAVAAFKAQHAAHAPAGLGGVPGGERFDRHVLAIGKLDDIGITRHGGDVVLPMPAPRMVRFCTPRISSSAPSS